jgi:hypothetical protein
MRRSSVIFPPAVLSATTTVRSPSRTSSGPSRLSSAAPGGSTIESFTRCDIESAMSSGVCRAGSVANWPRRGMNGG